MKCVPTSRSGANAAERLSPSARCDGRSERGGVTLNVPVKPLLSHAAPGPNDMVCLWMPLSWANEVQYTGLNEAATKENDNGILRWIGRFRQRNVDLHNG